MTTTVAVREWGIPFSGPLIAPIQADTKTVTRRVIENVDVYRNVRAGDRLWVRETFSGCWGVLPNARVVTEASVRQKDGRFHPASPAEPISVLYRADGDALPLKHLAWKPSIHMPRWASRILLEAVEDPYVERIQDITEEQARIEGVQRGSWPDDVTADDHALTVENGYFPPRSYLAGFANTWDDLNLKRGFGWAANPRVRVISFRRIAEQAVAA